MDGSRLALQLYTVRELMAEDFAGTLARVAEIGYRAVEFAGAGGHSPEELRKMLDVNGLGLAACHASLNDLENSLESTLEFWATVGTKHLVCPWLDPSRRTCGDDYRTLGEILTKIGAASRERGMQFSYHHHAFEFERFDGEYGFDILFGSSDPDLVRIELDTYWVQKGGESPVNYLRKYSGRVPIVHLKDMTDDEEQTFAEVGEGCLDFASILEAARAAGVDWYVVEQDRCARPPLESAAISLRNLHQMGFASRQ